MMDHMKEPCIRSPFLQIKCTVSLKHFAQGKLMIGLGFVLSYLKHFAIITNIIDHRR